MWLQQLASHQKSLINLHIRKWRPWV